MIVLFTYTMPMAPPSPVGASLSSKVLDDTAKSLTMVISTQPPRPTFAECAVHDMPERCTASVWTTQMAPASRAVFIENVESCTLNSEDIRTPHPQASTSVDGLKPMAPPWTTALFSENAEPLTSAYSTYMQATAPPSVPAVLSVNVESRMVSDPPMPKSLVPRPPTPGPVPLPSKNSAPPLPAAVHSRTLTPSKTSDPVPLA